MAQFMWYTAAHSCTGVLNQSAAVQHYRRSTFCLAPPGDSLTRKSLFDSYLTGCIPVLFARASLTQYSWHLSPEEIEASTVYIPKLDVINGAVKFMDVLKAIRPEAISRKQRVIEQLAPRLQYSMVPKSHPAPPKGSASNPNPWIAPFPDAAEVTIDHILDSRTIEPVTGFSAAELREMQVRQRRRMETDPDYMGMAQKIPGEKRKGKHRNKKKRFGRQGEDQPAAVAAGVREDEI